MTSRNRDRLDPPADGQGDPGDPGLDRRRAPEADDIEALVGQWLFVPDMCARWGVSPTRIRQMIEDRDLLGWRVGERRVLAIPALFAADEGPRSDLKGTFTVLADGGMSDSEILRWLFTPDSSLPVPGAPIDALVSGHKTEVRRRAQAAAF